MTDQPEPRGSRRTTAVLVGVLVLVLVVVAVIGIVTSAGGATPTATATGSALGTAVPAGSASASSAPSGSGSASSRPRPTPAATASTPQPTRTAAIASSAPIVRSLTAAVTRMTAVKGTATGPGEIAGPSVRFTVRITNRTGARFDLSNTVINVYSGADSVPAVQLQGPGGKALPASVADGASATGVLVFNIPESDRAHVEVTVDTSVRNPVVAFTGAAPR